MRCHPLGRFVLLTRTDIRDEPACDEADHDKRRRDKRRTMSSGGKRVFNGTNDCLSPRLSPQLNKDLSRRLLGCFGELGRLLYREARERRKAGFCPRA